MPWPATAAQLLSDLLSVALAAEPDQLGGSEGGGQCCGSRFCSSNHSCSFELSSGSGGCRRSRGAGGGVRFSASTEEQAAVAERAAFRRAALRWHPDKFTARYRKRVPQTQWPQLLKRVHAFTQELTAAAAAATALRQQQ